MSEDRSLGRLERVDLRKTWQSESEDFSPWLAEEENLALLGKTLNMELEFVDREKGVGSFWADILCRDVEDNSYVLIENQLEKADHNHLGQLLTYAAGLEAATIIWIAKSFTEEHRAALDWLNEITEQRFRFFGLEVELWRIGDSKTAPKFNIVSKPNDWSRDFRSIGRGELTSTRLMQRDYWEEFGKVLNRAKHDTLRADRVAQAKSNFYFKMNRRGFGIEANMSTSKKHIAVEIWIYADNAQSFFTLLREDREKIEKEIEFELNWKPNRKRPGIGVYEGADPEDRNDWPRQHAWLVEKLIVLYRVFDERVKNLNIDDLDGSKFDKENEDGEIV